MNTQSTGLRVFVVDDAASMRSLLRAVVTQEGHQVVGELPCGRGFHEALQHLQPDIVCLDNNLPDSTGLELLKTAHLAHPRLSVILITGDTNPTLERTAAECGAAGFIRKPFTPDTIIKELRQVAHAQRLLRLSKAEVESSADKPAPRARAVIADDSATIRLLLSSILQNAGIQVIAEASDGEQTIRLVTQHKPDMVCLDMEMPLKNGLEVLQSIRSTQPTVKVLMVTGQSSREAVMQAGKLGARGYIFKPFQVEGVVAAVNKLLAAT